MTPSSILKEPKNRYGVDVAYFKKELSALSRSLPNRTPDELKRYLLKLSEVAKKIAFVDEAGKFHCQCGSTHNRGAVNGVDVYRCLGCGKAFRIREAVELR